MTVDEWVFEAVEKAGKNGASLREIQRYIDEHRYEELAIDTIESALDQLETAGRIARKDDRWVAVRRTSKEDALKRLFGDAPDGSSEDSEETP